MKNDINRLKQAVTIRQVLDYLNIRYDRKGGSYFLLCPNPNHNDTKATNCYFQDNWRNVYCSSCGKATHAVDLIMQYNYCDYGTACDIMWELAGRPGWYYVERQSGDNVIKKVLYVDRADMLFLGIFIPGTMQIPTEIATYKDSLSKVSREYSVDDKAYIGHRSVLPDWSDFFSESEFVSHILKHVEKKRSEVVEQRLLGNISATEANELLNRTQKIKDKVIEFAN